MRQRTAATAAGHVDEALTRWVLGRWAALLSPADRLVWVGACWRQGVAVGQVVAWRALLGELYAAEPHSPLLALAYGACCARAGAYVLAAHALNAAVRQAGLAGDFRLQAEALLARVALARATGAQAAAQSDLDRLARYAPLWRGPHMRDIQLHHVQALLDAGDTTTARALLAPWLEKADARTLGLLGALLLAEGDANAAYGCAAKALARVHPAGRMAGRLHDLAARACWGSGDAEQALTHNGLALHNAETNHDNALLGRALGTQVVLWADLYGPDAAGLVYTRAEAVLRAHHDVVALALLHHNAWRCGVLPA